jgi:hypothetical protein
MRRSFGSERGDFGLIAVAIILVGWICALTIRDKKEEKEIDREYMLANK